ncbi:lipopolysaccharide biosynthesis protein [Holdemania massiliensis]|uniref:lipopolysaccharide biosynthesis protein n=1 Tax=Holdemania massiliensis TaxID=1468449 RepID=UPI0002F2D9EC|nr:lipopolysaccharide biosynthesis protein [Holdemania massiliensis]
MKGQKIVSGVGWSFAERLVSQIVTFIVSIVLARLLAPEDYGILALVNVFVSIADALVIGGFGIALIQKKDADEQDFNSVFWLSISISVALYLILFFCAPYITSFYNEPSLTLITRILGIRLIFSAFNSIQHAYIQKVMQFRRLFFTSTSAAILSGTAGVLAAIYGAGVWALIIQQLLYIALSTGFLYIVIAWKPKFMCSKNSIQTMWGYGCKVFLATMVDTLKDNIRSLVVGKVFSESDLAYYNQGKRFPQLLVNDIVNSVGKVLLPAFSEQQDDKEKNKGLMRMSIRISSFIVLPMIFGLIGIADVFIELVLTEKWLPCVPYLRILSLVYMSRSLNTVMKNSLLSIGKSGVNLFHEIVTSVLTIILVLMAAFIWKSVELIAWSYVIVSGLGTIIFSYFVIREYKYLIKEIIRDYVPALLLALFMSLVVYAVGKIALPLAIKLLLQISIGVLIYIDGAKLFRMAEFTYISSIIKKILHKKKVED